jgi:hypothetical protein
LPGRVADAEESSVRDQMAEKSKVAEASSAEEPKIKETSSSVEPADGTAEEKGPAPEESLVVVESKMSWPTYGRSYEPTRVAVLYFLFCLPKCL